MGIPKGSRPRSPLALLRHSNEMQSSARSSRAGYWRTGGGTFLYSFGAFSRQGTRRSQPLTDATD